MSVRYAKNEEALSFSGEGPSAIILLRQLAAAIEATGAEPSAVNCFISYDGNDGIEFLLTATISDPQIEEGT